MPQDVVEVIAYLQARSVSHRPTRPKPLVTEVLTLMAQMRFDDGQMHRCPEQGSALGYNPEEFLCLQAWLTRSFSEANLKQYFVNDVMQYRQEDLQQFESSDLGQHFATIEAAYLGGDCK